MTSGSGQQVHDVLDGLVGLVMGGLRFALRAMRGIGLAMEPAIGQRPAEAFVKEQEQECDLKLTADR